MRRTLMLPAAVLALAGCSPPAATEAAPAAAGSPAASTAEAFVRSLYQPGAAPGDATGTHESRPVWSARTKALLDKAARLTPDGEVGFFEADPICDCQDGTPVLQSATAVSTGPGRADVAIVQGFAEPGNALHRKTYNLVLEDGQWRIDDQRYESMGDFPYAPMVQRLEAWIAEAGSPG